MYVELDGGSFQPINANDVVQVSLTELAKADLTKVIINKL